MYSDTIKGVGDNDIPDTYYECKDTTFCVLLSIIVVGITIFCATISSSFHYVEYYNYALLRDVYGTVRLSKTYTQGRYFFPTNYDMITFPSYYINVEFEEKVFTDTGLTIMVDIGFRYRLPAQNVGKIYNEFSMSYHDLVVINARTTIKNQAATLPIDSYIYSRSEVEELFAQSVQSTLATVLRSL